jgi:S-DNA-T family DNA segregation ATPase FtsK/SpoIIIE
MISGLLMRSGSESSTSFITNSARVFFFKKFAQAFGAGTIALVLCTLISLLTWSAQDPSWNFAHDGPVRNALGAPGALVSDLIMQLWGIAALSFLAPIGFWGWILVKRNHLDRSINRVFLLICGSACMAGLASFLPATANWPLPTGLGGVLGDTLNAIPRRLVDTFPIANILAGSMFAIGAIVSLTAALSPPQDSSFDADQSAGTKLQRKIQEDGDADGEPGFALVSLGALVHAALSIKARINKRRKIRVGLSRELQNGKRIEPVFPPHSQINLKETKGAQSIDSANSPSPSTSIVPAVSSIKMSQRASREAQRSFLEEGFRLPELAFLAEPKKLGEVQMPQDALEQNARLLESVLGDFGVRGEIVNVRPGPVVTLYELEPAPGIKSSRIIGLADDIARSMSSVSARVAVVSGRNAIGIELPNIKRETVYLRELVASVDFESSKHRLAIALGKTIGGEPVIVDLTRMPHLLVAGTTGSGKSVAINTFILSLLYRLTPSECRMIMIDPKMLELSVYDGIPHLLTPVVTDPKKAVVALKWAVKEMEDRYKKMSKLGVRNIDGFNARILESKNKGEVIYRTVQTGFDPASGEAVYEREEIDLSPLPYIVVIVDEMADLMMVAGKDIEGAIQRLAQMARAAGIHLIMATQRPSVDVITGTIKANFPTRISFQVTSKIDSRTILGEQGAEQLLGQGDMLYMAGGGRISRVHGPFVSDTEVEKIVAHLKGQGRPEYLESITEDDENLTEAEAMARLTEDSSDLFDKAVAVVLRDGKCSTSYIQRRLSIGYNKAASIVERMEEEGIVGPANHAGKREILIGDGASVAFER